MLVVVLALHTRRRRRAHGRDDAMSIPAIPGVVQGPRELYRAPDPSGIFELVDRLGEGSYGAVYKVGPPPRPRAALSSLSTADPLPTRGRGVNAGLSHRPP